ncbi:hypothetical protein Tco_0967011 [Tanacetum coccineum]
MNYLQHPMQNLKDISNPTTALDMALELMAKAFQLNNTTPTNNNQRSSSNPCYSQIAQSGMNIDQDRHMLMVDDNVGNQFRQNAVQNVGHLVGQNAAQNQGIQNVRNQNGLSVVLGIANQHRNGNIAQKEEAGIQPNSEEFDFMAAAGAYNEIEEINANCTLKDNLHQASTSGTQTNKAPVYDSDGSVEVQLHDNCYNNEIFNMLTQEEHMEQGGGTIEQHSATVEETRAYHESLFHNLAAEVEKVNSVNRKMKETNAELTTELARYKNQVKCFDISQEKYDKLKRCYQKSVNQEQCLTKKINALHLSSGKQITALNEEISNLNKQLSKEKTTVSSLQEEKKMLKSDFKIRKDEFLDKQIQLENKIKELDNILVKTGQSIQTMHMLSLKPNSFYHTEQKMALGYQNPFYLKQAQQKQQSLYNGKVL